MYLKAYGKINLALDVLRKREDGYHDVRMIMQTVGIFDGIEITRTDTGRIEIVLTWTEKGYGMVIQTTARNDVELIQIGYELEKRFGNSD